MANRCAGGWKLRVKELARRFPSELSLTDSGAQKDVSSVGAERHPQLTSERSPGRTWVEVGEGASYR
jgi:hypothetical protein